LKECKVVAEIGAHHLAQMDRAKELIKLARLAGAHYAKFQKRNPDESTPEHLKNQPHPNEKFAYGKTYLEHRKNLELSLEQHAELKEYCESIGIGYSSSVWDMTSAREIVSLKPDFIKIGSPCNQNQEMIKFLFSEYEGNIHISLGMVTPTERDALLAFLHAERLDYSRVVLYNCTSEYPCPFERLYLKEIELLRNRLVPVGMEIGFSNHGYGIAMDLIAYALGATWIERHFVDDRTLRHTDAAVALEPDGLRRVCRDLKAAAKALQYRPSSLSEDELAQRKKLKGDT
jgi:N-acetylneuraminate synthase